jgi:hypothetical protein
MATCTSPMPPWPGRITIDISGSTTSVQGLPEGTVIHGGHRPWMTELVDQARLRKKA